MEELTAKVNVEVLVVDERDLPARQLEVWLVDPGQPAPRAPVTSTDDAGTATLALGAAEQYRLVVVTPGPGAPRWVEQLLIPTCEDRPAAPRTLLVRGDAKTVPLVRLCLAEGRRLEGQVLGESAPPWEASLLAIPLRPPWGLGASPSRGVRVTPDGAGHIVLEGLQATQWLLSVVAVGQELDVRGSASTSYWRDGRPWVLCHPLIAE